MNYENKITVALVEDKPDLQKSISERLSLFDEIELLFIADNGQRAVDKLDFEQRQVILMDIETKYNLHSIPQVIFTPGM